MPQAPLTTHYVDPYQPLFYSLGGLFEGTNQRVSGSLETGLPILPIETYAALRKFPLNGRQTGAHLQLGGPPFPVPCTLSEGFKSP